MSDPTTVTITLPLLDARKLVHLYRWALDQPDQTAGPEWHAIYDSVQRQIDEQARG